MNKRVMLVSIITILIIGTAVTIIMLRNQGESGSSNIPASVTNEQQGEVQRITLSFKEYNYYPQTITVKQGIPVELTLDDTVTGCYRAFVISDLSINTYTKSSAQKIRFTPTKVGTFKFQCSMGMGYGTLIVEP